MTLEEWFELPDEVEGELVDGYLVEEEVPYAVHEIVLTWLLRKLGDWVDSRGGVAAASGVKFAVGPRTGRKPDMSVFLPDRMPPALGLVRIPPYIAVEIVSQMARDRRRDRVETAAEYAAFGIPWYWIVEWKPRDGLVLDLDALWAQLDRLR
jgi:Uma2 family endonuclease